MVSIRNAQFVGICRCENIYLTKKKKKKKHDTRLDRAAVNFILCVSFISNMNNEYVGIHFCGDTSNERQICIFCIFGWVYVRYRKNIKFRIETLEEDEWKKNIYNSTLQINVRQFLDQSKTHTVSLHIVNVIFYAVENWINEYFRIHSATNE